MTPEQTLIQTWRARAERLDDGGLGTCAAMADSINKCADELEAILQTAPREQKSEEDTRVDEPKVIPPERATAPVNEVTRALKRLAGGIAMLGVTPREHAQSAGYNEALRLAASYVNGFIGREMLLTGQPCPDCGGVGQRHYAAEVTDGCDRCDGTGTVAIDSPADDAVARGLVDASQAAPSREKSFIVAAPPDPQGWQAMESCPQDGLFLVFEDGAMRMMYRSRGEWQATAMALDAYGVSTADIKVRETGVYNPTYWRPLPLPPAPPQQTDEQT